MTLHQDLPVGPGGTEPLAPPPTAAASRSWTSQGPLAAAGQPGLLFLLGLALVYTVLALGSAWLSRQPGQIASVWYANAPAVVALLLHRRAGWPLLLGVLGLANLAANRLWGDGWVQALAFVPSNLLEIVLAAALLRHAQLDTSRLRTGLGLLQLLLMGAVLPQLMAGALAAITFGLLDLGDPMVLWLSWFESSVLGAVALLPLTMLLAGQPWAHSRAVLQDARLWLLVPATLAVALLCLAHLPFPFVYIGVPLLVAGMVLDVLGVALLALLCSLTVVGALLTGVFVPPPVTDDWQQAFVYLACTAALVPPQLLGASLAELRDSHARLLAGKAELRRANEGLQQFVRIASHDLREPLNTIAQFSALLAQDHGAQLPADGQRWLGLVQGEAQRMRALLDDVLQYAQVRQGELPTPVRVPLDAALADALQGLAARVQASGALLQIEPLPAVRGHAPLLVLLLQNLLANAMKFQPPGQRPQVRVSAQRAAGWVLLSVADNGIGIAPAEQARLFKPFQRLHRRRDYEGTGLGLALCQQIAQAHGGSISLVSAPGEGSTFNVRLPAAPD